MCVRISYVNIIRSVMYKRLNGRLRRNQVGTLFTLFFEYICLQISIATRGRKKKNGAVSPVSHFLLDKEIKVNC